MVRSRTFFVVLAVLAGAILMLTGGCKRSAPAKIILNVDGKTFSDASILIDGKPAGRLTQTVITADRKIYIDGVFSANLPPASQPVEGDTYSGCADSIIVGAGNHTISLQAPDGASLQILAAVSPGYHLLAYSSDEKTLKWDGEKVTAEPGAQVTVGRKKGGM
ncbi:MAG: hypothetical protein A4E65_01788 [Syntrophorhabdus sp. PtaU1.Bin153]|nr:MAG: hypothetical protein A4E65_01788 [Syntrophorhabdus sp. PtaU1.Bin153]